MSQTELAINYDIRSSPHPLKSQETDYSTCQQEQSGAEIELLCKPYICSCPAQINLNTQASLVVPPRCRPARSLLRDLLVPTCPQGAVGLQVCTCLTGMDLSTVGPIGMSLWEFGIRREAVSRGPSSWVPAQNMHRQEMHLFCMVGHVCPCMSHVPCGAVAQPCLCVTCCQGLGARGAREGKRPKDPISSHFPSL